MIIYTYFIYSKGPPRLSEITQDPFTNSAANSSAQPPDGRGFPRALPGILTPSCWPRANKRNIVECGLNTNHSPQTFFVAFQPCNRELHCIHSKGSFFVIWLKNLQPISHSHSDGYHSALFIRRFNLWANISNFLCIFLNLITENLVLTPSFTPFNSHMWITWRWYPSFNSFELYYDFSCDFHNTVQETSDLEYTAHQELMLNTIMFTQATGS